MNWDALSFDWNQVRAFLATAEEGSFSAAARALKTTQPTVGRQVASLEESLGLALIERSGRGLALTETGLDLLEHVQRMGDAAAKISLVADGQSSAISGKVTISATDLMSAALLPELLAPLRTEAPGIALHILPSNDLSNLMRREADIAIRHVRPEQPELIARHIGNFRANLYAATSLLDERGRPAGLSEIATLPMVGVADPERLIDPLNQMGIPVTADHFVASSPNGGVTWELVKASYGASMLPEFLCDAEPGVERVYPALPSIEFPVWLVTHRELKTSGRIRVVFDLLAEGLSKAVG
ncbi:LysR family transcriptional regulator [Altererythrobacter sp. MF3-039]|uniref:LysR family transcriptional regulator n=1 Tax=Altererythrobacter sp. MF3-039 TaxID=3252901 RepID=UPI00390CAB99